MILRELGGGYLKFKKIMLLIIVILLAFNIIGCSSEKIEEEPYIKYIITTYSGGKEIEKFEVWSNMGWYFSNDTVKVYDSPSERVLLFRTTLDYKVKSVNNK